MRKLILIAVAMLLAACSKDIQNTESVKQGVLDYLRARTAQTGLDVNSLQVDVTSVAFEKDQARATVSFKPKTGDGGGPMLMNYVLDRKGGKWVVRGRTENGLNPHGGASPGTGAGEAMPPGHPATGAEPPLMPAPGTPGPTGTLPPGHPPIGSKK